MKFYPRNSVMLGGQAKSREKEMAEIEGRKVLRVENERVKVK